MTTKSKPKVVLVHGIFNTGHIMYLLKWILERNGFECFAPTVKPIDGRGGIERLSTELKRQVENRFGKSERLSFIGFSLGGIVARYYLQELNGAERTDSLFTLASPHHGSYWAYFPYFTKGIKQLRPKSQFLLELEKGESKLKKLKLFSYYTPFDTSIVPSSSSIWRIATNKKFYSILHLTVLFNFRLIKELIKQLPSHGLAIEKN